MGPAKVPLGHSSPTLKPNRNFGHEPGVVLLCQPLRFGCYRTEDVRRSSVSAFAIAEHVAVISPCGRYRQCRHFLYMSTDFLPTGWTLLYG